MKYILSEKYDEKLIKDKIMGPNPLKLEEELLKDCKIKKGGYVMDLGSGNGITSVFLAKEYGYRVIAADLWSNPSDNKRFFEEMGLTDSELTPIKADAENLPFSEETFDGVVCVDSYNYFGRDDKYLGEKLLPCIKKGGYIYICVTGMKKNCHDNLPKELLLSWTPEQLEYMQDKEYWRTTVEKTDGIEIVAVEEMESNEEVWADWLKCDNDYARRDAASVNAGALNYLNFIKIIIKKK